MHEMTYHPIRDFKYYVTLGQDLLWHFVRRLRHRLGVFQERSHPWYRTIAPAHSQKLSTCVITMNAAHRLAPLIAHAKTFSDEVVIGVDSKTTDNTFEVAQAAGADVVFWIENDALTCNAGLEALVDHCSGDWILRLDDDEYMEPSFLGLKDHLITQSAYTHFKFPRLHISSVSPLKWVDDSYLYPDYQMRFFKNDKSILHFPGAVGHTAITSDGPKGRIFTTNIIHLNLAINTRQKREEKLQRYIKRHQGQWVHPINEYALLFENFPYCIRLYRCDDVAFTTLLESVVNAQRQADQAPVLSPV